MEGKHCEHRSTINTTARETGAVATFAKLVLDIVHDQTSVEPFMLSELC
jgi:hypothetical protein